MTIEYWRSPARQWYFRIVARNAEIIAQSEGYTQKANCLKAIATLQQQIARANVMQTEPVERTIKDSPVEGTLPRATVRRAVQSVVAARMTDHPRKM